MGLILLDILPQDKKPWVALFVGVVAIAYVMFKPKMRFGGARKDPLKDPAKFGSLSQQRSVERQMENLLVELSEMARQISGQLDTRAAKLEALIGQADERIEKLRLANDAAGGGAGATAGGAAARVNSEFLFPMPPSVSASPTLAMNTPHMKISHRDEEPDPRHAEVYRLADQGRAAKEIATALGRPAGEIELILALRPRRAS